MITITVSGRRKASRTSFIFELVLPTTAGDPLANGRRRARAKLTPTQVANLNNNQPATLDHRFGRHSTTDCRVRLQIRYNRHIHPAR